MKFLPTENITYKSRLNEDEIIRRLSDIIEPEKTFRLISGSSKPYEGQIKGLTFNIKRILEYRNSFQPIINGIIKSEFDGMKIKVRMRLHFLTIIFLCIWCGGVGLVCIAFLIHTFSKSEFDPVGLIPFGMLIFVYAFSMGGFKFESNKSKKYLQTILEADIIEA